MWDYSTTEEVDWSDIDGDGVADVVLRDRQLFIKGQPDWGVERRWIGVSLDEADGDFAGLTVLATVAQWPWEFGLNPVRIWDEAPDPPSAGRVVTVPAVPEDPDLAAIEYSFGQDGVLDQVAWAPEGGDTLSGDDISITVSAVPSAPGPPPDVPADSVSLTDLPASEWVLRLSATACSTPASPARTTCVERMIGEATIGEWLSRASDPAVAALVPSCP